jgi:hypothetical protein
VDPEDFMDPSVLGELREEDWLMIDPDRHADHGGQRLRECGVGGTNALGWGR